MILTLCKHDKTVHIEISTGRFECLRRKDISDDEIASIASECGVDASILTEYTADLKKSVKESFEIDGSCDYSDHL